MQASLPLVGIGSLVGAYWLPGAAAVAPPAARCFAIPTRAPRGEGVVITFDDGPHPRGTPAILSELERSSAHAVFFVSGEQVERYPSVLRDVVASGHELGLHGYRHQTRLQWTRRLFVDDARRSIDAVGVATGLLPTLYRPPHGVFSVAGLREVSRVGLEPLLWSRWARDWEARATPASIVRRATASIAARDVILLHDADHYGAAESWRRTAAAL
ncbi:MAG: polysaccharide deacetylase family protein, partial [Thermoleophilia bacterium]|nr:polysaccharide deacetylase family protein [Thermoleophilia bacterium]